MSELKYWKNGEPVLMSDNSSIKELKYWLDGQPYASIKAGGGGSMTEITLSSAFSLGANISKKGNYSKNSSVILGASITKSIKTSKNVSLTVTHTTEEYFYTANASLKLEDSFREEISTSVLWLRAAICWIRTRCALPTPNVEMTLQASPPLIFRWKWNGNSNQNDDDTDGSENSGNDNSGQGSMASEL